MMTTPNPPNQLKTTPVPGAGLTRNPIRHFLFGCALMFLVIQFGTIWLAGTLDLTWSALIATGVMLGLALGLEKWSFKRDPFAALNALGFGALSRICFWRAAPCWAFL